MSRRDCKNVNDYYLKRIKMKMNVMSTRELFEFITSSSIGAGEEEPLEGSGDDGEEEEEAEHLDRSQYTKEEWKEKKKEIKAKRAEQVTKKTPKHVKKRFKAKASNNSKRGKT